MAARNASSGTPSVTEHLYRQDAYLTECEARVVSVDDDGIVLDRTVFYPLGGGQPGDSGYLQSDQGSIRVQGARHGPDGAVMHIPEGGTVPVGAKVRAVLDWDRRYAHMRMHTCLHLLGALVPHGVTGGNISETRSRLDFDMTDTVDKIELTEKLNRLIEANHPVESFWISEEELDARPELIRTLSVRPPRGVGEIRLLQIPGVDLQPCGGTHVRQTGEIGPVRIGKVEKKGRHNRRIAIEFAMQDEQVRALSDALLTEE
jgi:misacylated tRNA(Ala) deacylase